MKADWLADVLRAAGLTVHEAPGWRTRGKELRHIRGVVAHHTATGKNWTDARVVELLIEGRSDLPGPLSQLGLRRDGSYDLIAAGRANHNGYGAWGNDCLGIEAYNDGKGEPWPAVQIDAYERGSAAILAHLGKGAQDVQGHKEQDPKRKIDPAGIDMARFRTSVARLIAAPVKPPPSEEDTMTPAQEHKVDRLLASNTRIEEALRGIAKGLAKVEGIAQTDYAAQLIDIAEQREKETN